MYWADLLSPSSVPRDEQADLCPWPEDSQRPLRVMGEPKVEGNSCWWQSPSSSLAGLRFHAKGRDKVLCDHGRVSLTQSGDQERLSERQPRTEGREEALGTSQAGWDVWDLGKRK